MRHPLFLDQVEGVVAAMERARLKDTTTYTTKTCAKRLAAILKLAFEDIPHDPSAAVYRQGNTPGSGPGNKTQPFSPLHLQ
jgi:toxin YhaV